MILHSQTSATIVYTPTARRRTTGALRPLVRQRQRFATAQVPSTAKVRSPERIACYPGAHVVSLRHAGGIHTQEEAKAIAEHLDATCIHGRTRSPACADGMIHSVTLPVIR
jgi:hypothetical protein